ncbi:MAG: hypothetical protein HZB91_04330 [Elusimicrobia bacterium]|nr:hypothetical protein [Elusimicrobiota bacterium]
MTAPSIGYDIAVVIPSDYPALAGFLAEFLAEGRQVPGGAGGSPLAGGGPDLESKREFWLSRFRLWWDENPAFRPEAPRGWMLRRRGTLVGFLAHSPSLMWSGNRPLQVFSVSTWMVLPEHRDASLDLLFKQMDASKATLLFDTTPTEHVAAILENFGFERLAWGSDRESVALLRPAACLKARLAGLSWLPEAAWKAGGWLLELVQRARSAGASAGPGLRVEEMKDIGPAFDRLWERTKGLHRLTNVRTSEILRWHCLADRQVEKKLFACWSQDEVAGWMIAKVNRRRGLKALEVVDYWADPAFSGTFASLLAAVLAHGAAQGFDLAVFGHFSPAFEANLSGAGLWEVPLKARRNLCLAGPACTVTPGEEGASFTALQGDYGTSP